LSIISRALTQFRVVEFRLRGDQQVWLRRLIILGVIGASLALPLLPSQRYVMLIAAPVVGGVIAYVFLRWPVLGLAAIIFGTLLFPTPGISDQLAGRFNITMLLVVALVGLWLFDMLTRQRQFKLVPSRTNLPLLLLILISGISFINGRLNYYALAQVAPLTAQIGGVALILLSVGAYFLMANQIKTRLWLQRLTWLFVALGALYVFSRLTAQTRYNFRHLFQYGADASLFWLWLACITASQALINRQLKPRWRIALGAIFLGAAYISFIRAYTWKSGWIPAAVGLGVIVWMGYPRWRISMLMLGIGWGLFNIAVVKNVAIGGEDYSILTRVEAWRIVLEITRVNPFLGLGPSNYYWYTPLFSILGYYGLNFSSHNNYIDIFAQYGILGLLGFLWFIWEAGWLGLGLKERVSEGFDKAYVIGALGGLAGTLVAGMLGDWVIPFIYNVGVHGFRSSVFTWIFLGGLVVLEEMYRIKTDQQNQDR